MTTLSVRRLIPAILLVACAAVPLSAQVTDAQESLRWPQWEFGPYLGVARNSPAGTRLGVMPDRDHLFIGLHATINFMRTHRWTLGYAPEIVPLLLISNNPRYRYERDRYGGGFLFEDGRGPVAGFAFSPIGLEMQIRLGSRWRAYGAGAAGGVWFSREVPVAYARAFNYTFEFGGGILWRYGARHSLRVGYKFHHLSNAYTAPQNPGIDGSVFLLGFERSIGRGR